jgi:hypothetical protein
MISPSPDILLSRPLLTFLTKVFEDKFADKLDKPDTPEIYEISECALTEHELASL